MAEFSFPNKKKDLVIHLKREEGNWLVQQIPAISVHNRSLVTFSELEKSFEHQTGGDFVLFWNSPVMKQLRENGLLML